MTVTRDTYMVTIAADGIGSIKVLLDAAPPIPASGYGGWTVVNRQRRVGLTTWEGKDPLRVPLSVLFDGVSDGTGQEVLISRLSRMALPPTTGGEPPQVTVKGPGFPNYGPRLWVIENLQWGTNVIQDFAANGVMGRLRQDCVVNLLEYRGDDRIQFKGIQPGKVSKKATSGKSTSGWPKTYTIKSGDTLRAIANKFYGDATKWKKIADANNIRDPQVFAAVNGPYFGKTIRIPAP